jgi:hypothetical protein
MVVHVIGIVEHGVNSRLLGRTSTDEDQAKESLLANLGIATLFMLHAHVLSTYNHIRKSSTIGNHFEAKSKRKARLTPRGGNGSITR